MPDISSPERSNPSTTETKTVIMELPAEVKAINTQLETDPRNIELLYQKATALARAKLWPETLESLEMAIKRDKENIRLWVLKGVAQRNLGHLKDAKSSYERALSLEPNAQLAHFNLGILYDLYLNQPQQAIEHFKRFQQLQTTPDKKVELWLTEIEQRLSKQKL